MIVTNANKMTLENKTDIKLWLPTTNKEVNDLGWEEIDVILFTGDAFIGHPSFGAAVIGRILEAEELKWPLFPKF